MKKLLSLLVTGLMVMSSISLVSAAEPEMTDRLTKVATQVKNQLSIGNDYSNFQGQLEDNGVSSYWELQWKKEDGATLTINASEKGKIMSYDYNAATEQTYRYDNDFAPAFPEISQEEAKKSAETFLANVIDATTENFVFNEQNQQNNLRNIKTYYFNGNINLNQLTSPIDANISVNALDCTVISFRRNDLYTKYIGEVPNPTTSITQQAASNLLYNTIKMKLEYTIDTQNSDKQSSNKAVLRYLPVSSNNYFVDAKTGELINTDELYKDINALGGGATAEMKSVASKADNGLSKVELDGIEKLKDVLSKEQLDSNIRQINELGLDAYTLSNANYSLNQQTNQVFCSLSYGLLQTKDNNKTVLHKNIYVNAKTGELISVYSNYNNTDEKELLTENQKQQKAEAFLNKYFSENYAKTKFYPNDSSYDIMHKTIYSQNYFTFAQNVNGYFFPQNNFNISIDPITGFIDSFSMNFNDVSFDSTEGIITDKQAIDAYASTYETKLSYISVPKKIDLSQPEYQVYAKLGHTYLYELKLAYTPYFTKTAYAIDAKSGKPLYYTNEDTQTIHYTDLDGSSNEIKELSKYGIGYSDSAFQPAKELTQVDLIALLVSADGYLYKTGDEQDSLYTRAYNLGILTKSERNPNKLITRSELAKTLLTMSGYGKTANLKGIFICNFTDEKDIKPEYYGFIAIAQGLGIIHKSGEFLPNKTATRNDAAIMLYNFMQR